MKTKVTELFGIEYPIICGGMLWVTDVKLCAAISNAGGMGCITADQFNNGDELRAAIREVKALTDKPFGVNITLMNSFRITKEIFMDFFRVCCEEKVANIEVSGMFATDFLPYCHAAGVKVTHKVGAVRHAKKIESLGYDAVIVAGVEEGGHPLNDNVALSVLLPKVAENVNIPIIATGGMVDGKGLASALCLGADGIMMATRFMASTECWIHDNIKQYICDLRENDTELCCQTVLQARAAKNEIYKQVAEMEKNGATASDLARIVSGKRLRNALTDGDINGAAFFVGQSVGRIDSVISCKEIIDNTIAGAKAVMAERSKLLED